MFHLIRLIIWLIGLTFVATFTLGFFGYEMNWNALRKNNATCTTAWQKCWKNDSNNGSECSIKCWTREPLIKKIDKSTV